MQKNDFSDFVKNNSVTTPQHLSDSILSHVKNELEPDHKIVFFKLFSIQAFVGVFSLLFCPQFELSLTNNYDLFHYFHYTFGEQICMMICGSIFLGSGALVASFLLNEFEIKRIANSKFLYSFSITSIALLTLFTIGTASFSSLLLFWLLGAIGSQFLIIYASEKLIFRKV